MHNNLKNEESSLLEIKANLIQVLGLVGGKWKLIILLFLLDYRTLRFSDLKEKVGITPSVLTSQLRELESVGLIHREFFDKGQRHVEYTISDKAVNLKEVINVLNLWWSKEGCFIKGSELDIERSE